MASGTLNTFFFLWYDWCNDGNSFTITGDLIHGEFSFVEVSCDDYYKRIKVGDRAYLLRTLGTNRNPTGIIAAGSVIEPPESQILKNKISKYSDLSAAYYYVDKEHVNKEYGVHLRLDSFVDFDVPLVKERLQKLPQFRSYGSNFIASRPSQDTYLKSLGDWIKFLPESNLAEAQALDSEWEKYSLAQQEQGKGRRLVDVFLKKGDEALSDEDYESASFYYKQALDISPKYAEAINKLKIFQATIGLGNEEVDQGVDLKGKDFRIITPVVVSSDPNFQAELARIRDQLANEESLQSTSAKDLQKRVLVEIARRQGQTKFRQALLDAYNYRCAITGFDAGEALEAAHIIPYAETENNDPRNGLLLRADLHTLFDLKLLAIHPDTFEIYLHPDLQQTEYRSIHGTKMRIPKEEAFRPDPGYLRQRLKQCVWLD